MDDQDFSADDNRVARVTLGQWRVFRAVVDAGGYARAAERLHKSQSAVTYAIQKLERLLDVKAFELQGRRAVLTAAGTVLYRRSGDLLDEAAALEQAAARLAGGWEAVIRLAVDIVFPTWLLLECLGRFAAAHPAARVDLFETVLGGTEQALLERRADLAVSALVPQGFMGDPLMRLHFVAVAAPSHPLHALGRPVTYQDLRRHRQLVIRDSSTGRRRDAGWLGAEQRWTVASKATSIRAACMGLGFAWYPESMIREELASGALKRLALREGANRYATLYLVFADRDYAGPGVLQLAGLIREAADSLPQADPVAGQVTIHSTGS